MRRREFTTPLGSAVALGQPFRMMIASPMPIR